MRFRNALIPTKLDNLTPFGSGITEDLPKTQIGTFMQANLTLPKVKDNHSTCCSGEQSSFPFEASIFNTFRTIGTFHIHRQHRHVSSLTHPVTFCCLTAFLVHHGKRCSKEMVRKSVIYKDYADNQWQTEWRIPPWYLECATCVCLGERWSFPDSPSASDVHVWLTFFGRLEKHWT